MCQRLSASGHSARHHFLANSIYETRREFGGQEFRRNSRKSESLNCKCHALDAMGPRIDNRSGECGRRENGDFGDMAARYCSFSGAAVALSATDLPDHFAAHLAWIGWMCTAQRADRTACCCGALCACQCEHRVCTALVALERMGSKARLAERRIVLALLP